MNLCNKLGYRFECLGFGPVVPHNMNEVMMREAESEPKLFTTVVILFVPRIGVTVDFSEPKNMLV
jgi:hypothetical protein